MTSEERCHCGRPLHYVNPLVERFAREMVRRHGEYVPVTVAGRTWLVQRHYLALHGFIAAELPMLGFREVTGRLLTYHDATAH